MGMTFTAENLRRSSEYSAYDCSLTNDSSVLCTVSALPEIEFISADGKSIASGELNETAHDKCDVVSEGEYSLTVSDAVVFSELCFTVFAFQVRETLGRGTKICRKESFKRTIRNIIFTRGYCYARL